MGNVEKESWFLFIVKHYVSTKYVQYICNFQIADTVMNKTHIIKSQRIVQTSGECEVSPFLCSTLLLYRRNSLVSHF